MNKVKLKDITLNITDGKHGDCKNEENSGYYFLSVKDISNELLDYTNGRQITKKDFIETDKRTKLEVGDTIYANSGHTIGKSVFIKDSPLVRKTTFQKSVAIIKPNKEKVDARFLYYLLKYETPRLRLAAVGSAQKNLLLDDIRNFETSIPSIDKQIDISTILGYIDNKIDINNKISKELDELAQTIYKYWFVQFEFPNEDGKPYRSSGGEMVWNAELEKYIPEEWEVKKLCDIFDFIKGRIPKEIFNNYTENSEVYLTIDVLNNGIPTYAIREGNILTKDEVLMVMDGAASGTVYQGFDGAVASTLSKLKIKHTEISNELLYYILKCIEVEIRKRNTGSTVPHANKEWISNYNICISTEVLKNINEKIVKLRKSIKHFRKENQYLIQLREWLLPIFMTGQLTLKIENDLQEKYYDINRVAETLSEYNEV